MSQESQSANIEIPGPWRYKFAKWNQGSKIDRDIELSVDGLELIRREGAVNAVANHRNRKWDVPIVGCAIGDYRTPFYPAKTRYGKGLLGLKKWILAGSGALFFDEESEHEKAVVLRQMKTHLKLGHMLLTFPEGTSRTRGRELGALEPGALEIALRSDLEEMLTIGLGGTETSSGLYADKENKPTRVHVEVGSFSLGEAREEYETAPKKERKELVVDLTERVLRPALQEVVDIAYLKAAA